MKSFEKELPEKQFLRVHKSYIVNLKKIERFDSKHIEIAGMIVKISKSVIIVTSDLINNNASPE